MIGIKPCPFCGSRSVFKAYNNYEDKKIRYVVCNNCRIQLQKHKAWNKGIDIVDAWNARLESAWEMFRRLHRGYGIRFLSKLNVLIKGDCKRSIIYWIADTPEKDAKEIMQDIEKELKE